MPPSFGPAVVPPPVYCRTSTAALLLRLCLPPPVIFRSGTAALLLRLCLPPPVSFWTDIAALAIRPCLPPPVIFRSGTARLVLRLYSGSRGALIPLFLSDIGMLAARRLLAVDLPLCLPGRHLSVAVPVTILGTGLMRKHEGENQCSKAANYYPFHLHFCLLLKWVVIALCNDHSPLRNLVSTTVQMGLGLPTSKRPWPERPAYSI